MPLVKFISPTDPRWLSTLDEIGHELVADSLVSRARAGASATGGDRATAGQWRRMPSGGEPPDAYRQLAHWLARRRRPVQDAFARWSGGRELGRELPSSEAGSDAEEAMGRTLTALGFAPQRERIKAGRIVFRLGNCPYRDAVRENQPVVCAPHRGLTRGLLDELEPSAVPRRFVAEDPDRPGCVIEVDGFVRA